MPVPPFWCSIVILSLVQGALVAVPGTWAALGRRLARFRSGWWALVPVVSLVVVAFGLLRANDAPQGLTYLALVGVPTLAAAGFGWAMRGARPWFAGAALPLFALAWWRPGDLWGQGASLVLTALACVTLGVALVALAPAMLVRVGVVVMAIADTALVAADLLQKPNSALVAAHPIAQLPRLQSVLFGSAVMGFGDLFVAALVGALYASAPARQRRAAVIVAACAVIGDLAFLRISEFPATLPVALGMLIADAWERWQEHGARRVTSL